MTPPELSRLLTELRTQRRRKETEWVEFKMNHADPERIGRYLSALSNSAALHDRDAGYIVWGVDDETLDVVGTTFRPHLAKAKSRKGKESNEDLEPWLLRLLRPQVDFTIHEFRENGQDVVLFKVQPAPRAPVAFSG